MSTRVGCMAALVALAATPAPALAQELAPPDSWLWVTDAAARLTTGKDVSDSTLWFVSMPPGWHITTGPGTVFFDPQYTARGRFIIASEFVLFQGESQAEYGVFLGGLDLIGRESGSYTAFVLRRDGSAAVQYRIDGEIEFVVPWTRHEAVNPHPDEGTVTNVVAVVVDGPDVSFRVNETEVAALSGDMVRVEGQFGFRIGRGLNLHITSLDFTQRLALPRLERD